MPEGDIARRVAIRLTKALVGQPITYSQLRWPTLGAVSLTGQTIESIEAVGKHLLMHLDNQNTLRTHLRMDGAWYIEKAVGPGRPARTGRARSPKARAVIANQQWVAIGWLLGMADLLRTRDLPRLLGHLGPDVMADGFDAEQAATRVLAQGSRTIGATLLDQTVVTGIGTIYMAESLFRWRVRPDRPANQTPDVPGLLDYAASILHRSVAAEGPTATGLTTAGEITMVHGRQHMPCRLCQTPIEVMMVGLPPFDRPAWYCPACQPN
ncbi:MAG: Fpg/Nei family DNA glycosylase [Micrococcales bacterium]|nr:Fpg/Nei family DNA glycosylase [Micrococcales bacterium]